MSRSSFSQLAYAAILVLISGAGCAGAVEDRDDGVAATAEALSKCPPEVPEAIKVPEGNKYAFSLDAEGVQMYQCQATASGGFGWVFLAPEADLFGKRGRIAGSHYVGPTWEALDGSTVVGARVNGVTVDPTAIPWLLLRAVSNTGSGRMTPVTFIQRVDTTAGLAPSSGCDADHVGEQRDVDYTATYHFYKATGAD